MPEDRSKELKKDKLLQIIITLHTNFFHIDNHQNNFNKHNNA